MSRRHTLLVNEETYHIFNRSIARQPILTKSKDYQRFFEIIDFYRFTRPGLRYSHYNRLPFERKMSFLDALYKTGKQSVEIYAFSLMPNHFHILAKQLNDDGIRLFMSQLQNSYAKFFNVRFERTGSLWQEMFKAERIETDEQFIHVTRYIHLNPLTSFVIKNPEELEMYFWTSFTDYMGKRNLPWVSKKMLMSHFPSIEKLRQFTLDQVNYQRTLANIKHLLYD